MASARPAVNYQANDQGLVELPQVNITQYPPVITKANRRDFIVIGDLHGNALLWVWIMVQRGVFEMTKLQYLALVEAYRGIEVEYKDGSAKLKNPAEATWAVNAFKMMLGKIKVKKIRAVHLIGDSQCDRGENDDFTNQIRELLITNGVPVTENPSNHLCGYLEKYQERKDNRFLKVSPSIKREAYASDSIVAHQTTSLINLGLLAAPDLPQLPIIDEVDIERRVDNYVLPNLKLFNYSFNTPAPGEKTRITIYTHAPVGFETLEAVADYYDVEYDNSSLEKLVQTLDAVNKAYLAEIMDPENEYISDEHDDFLDAAYPGFSDPEIKVKNADGSFSPVIYHDVSLRFPVERVMYNRPDQYYFRNYRRSIMGKAPLNPLPQFRIETMLPPDKDFDYTVDWVHGHIGASRDVFFNPQNPVSVAASVNPNMRNADSNAGKRVRRADFTIVPGSNYGDLQDAHFFVTQDRTTLTLNKKAELIIDLEEYLEEPGLVAAKEFAGKILGWLNGGAAVAAEFPQELVGNKVLQDLFARAQSLLPDPRSEEKLDYAWLRAPAAATAQEAGYFHGEGRGQAAKLNPSTTEPRTLVSGTVPGSGPAH